MQISTLRPGLLVGLNTRVQGNVSYTTREIEADHIEDDGTRQATWETNRVIEHPREHEESVKVRSKARSLVTGVCTPSVFGLLCPEADREKLSAAIAEARQGVDEFNARAVVTQVSIYTVVGRIAADDAEAVRAINSELRYLMETMESGLKRLDVKVVREAADKAKAMAAMLSPEAAERAEMAIKTARSAARRIVKAGEVAATEIDETVLRTIRYARAAFLDFSDEQGEAQTPNITGRAIDLEPSPIPAAATSQPPVPSLEL